MRSSVKRALVTTLAAASLVSGCGLFGGGATPSPTLLVSPPQATPTSGAGTEPTATADFIASPSIGASPEASGDLPPFSCSLPVSGSATIARAQITDVRVGTHDGYDRVVFEFAAGLPEHQLQGAAPPFFRDPSGMEFGVLGSDHLQLTLRGGTKQSETGTSTYAGPTSFHPHFPQLRQLEEAGDFEAQSTWIMGLSDGACVRVLTLDSPSRLVVDLQHP